MLNADTDAGAGRALTLSLGAWTILVTWSVVSVVLMCVTVNPLQPEIGFFRGSSDYFVYRDAAWHVLEGIPLYEHQLFEYHWWTYTPFAALFFLPFEFLPTAPDETGADQYIWMAVNFVLLVAIVVRCWQLLDYRVTRALVGISTLIAFGCVFLEPVRTTIFYGQVNLLLMWLVLWDYSRGEHSRIKGVGIGISAGIKLIPGYFAIYYAALGQWRAAAVALGTSAATLVVGWIFLPSDSWTYWSSTFFDSSRVYDELDHPANQSLRGAMAKIMDHNPAFWQWAPPAVAIAAVSLVIAVRLYRRDERLLSITLVGMSAAVVSPFTWSHHWVWFVPVVVYFMHRARTDPRWWLAVVALTAVIGSWAYQYWFEDEPRVGLYLFPPRWINADVLVNLYLVLFVPILIWFAWHAFRKPGATATAPRPRDESEPQPS